ncbi:DUF4381 domain-containing protein [Schauerella aestuarii]|uniref:DUF4381 domain-containing protein n=1 Tax=Schauerella aestuarii TaxID=2511204 RepID=UPI00137083B8|nr:DUF4381 domain-containing protein [Achromobacter aestuarii]MYZ45638.1 DUF4381 domain-containing protein [Achromobacter aestuarii]
MSDTAAKIEQLQQLPLPPAVAWLPQTWGWAVVAGALACALVVSAALWLRHHRRNRYRREAIVALQRMKAAAQADRRAIRQLPVLLKRVTLAATPDRYAASLTGNAFVTYLQSTGGRFPDNAGAVLTTLAYGDDAALAALSEPGLALVIHASEMWVERHHVAT